MPLYADIVLPLAQPVYTFAVAEGMALTPGQAVVVQFGRTKFLTGIAWRLHDRRPEVKTVKTISRTLYAAPLLSREQMQLWEWIADYYMCSLGEVMRVGLPTLIKPSGQSDEEFLLDEFHPRTELYYTLSAELLDQEHLNDLFEGLIRRAPKQYAALLELASSEEYQTAGEVARRLLSADAQVLRALQSKGFIRAVAHERTLEEPKKVRFRLPELTPAQQQTLAQIEQQFDSGKPVLLHGITGSGKTEIYIHLIASVLAQGGDVLLLIPEIALTAQLVARMELIFGSRVTTYHSKLTPLRRTESYLRLCSSAGGEFVVGVRSSLFLPLKALKLIIVDEEHDASYKQSEPAPRYNARDCALMLARLMGAHTLLGSATPSLESWANAESGKYGVAVLRERYGLSRPPQIIISDTIRAVKRNERKTHFNKELLDRIEGVLARGEQAMLFQNRRGFSPYLSCRACGWIPHCPQCNVTLTYHKGDERLVCHYCGHTEALPAKCPICEGVEVVPMGFGTEKVEQEILKLFPQARVARLDRDSVTSERAFSAIVSDFARGDYDILVGTQMITKGFDFGGVSLVGILNADNLLNNPDFRAAERAFQLMTQVAGRAGRRNAAGEVVIQTAEPDHPVIQQVAAGDYEAMARTQLTERAAFFYPPYARLISLTLRHRDFTLLRAAAHDLAARLRERFGRRLLGPMTPPVDKIRGEYLVGLLLKVEGGASVARAREILATELRRTAKGYKSIVVLCNVDPQ